MPTVELSSTGQLSQLFQRHPSEVRDACQELGILPSYRLNNVNYFSSQDGARLAEYFRRQSEPKNSR